MCAISLCAGRIGLGWARDVLTLHVTCSCIFHSFVCLFVCLFTYSSYCELFWDISDFLFFFLPLLLVTLVVSMAPKHKSTPTWNPLCSCASSSSNPSPSHIQFHDDDAFKAFSKNFSRRDIHSERQVILSDFADTNLPSVIHNKG